MENDVISLNSSPVLRITTDISELKDNTEYVKQTCHKTPSRESKSYHNGNPYVKKKTLHPLHGSNSYHGRNSYGGSYHVNTQDAKSNVSSFTQRVMSAKLLRVKQLQNQLGESQARIAELINENRLLKTLQRRQDSALKKYEGSQEQLPQLIKSHNEEIRILNTKFKQLRLNYRLLENKLKDRDTELMNLKEQHKHLLKLSRDKQLGDREKLAKKLEDMEVHVKNQQEKIHTLTRKVELEGKNYRHRLNLEITRHKGTQKELQQARKILDSLKTIDGKKKYVNVNIVSKRVDQLPSTSTSQQSQISLPAAPPNVSIRQPARLVFSETRVRDEDSDSDSFSFGLQNMPVHNADDDDSDRSESDIDVKPVNINNINDNNISPKIQIEPTTDAIKSKENYSGNNETVIKDNSNKLLIKTNSVEIKPRINEIKSNTVGNKLTNGRLNIKLNKSIDNSKKIIDIKPKPMPVIVHNSSRRNSKSEVKNSSRRNSINEQRRHSTTVLKLNSKITKSNSLENNIDNELKNIQTEIEKELNIVYKKPDDLLTKDNNISMDAAIEELERKFKIFDMPQIRKEAEDGINRIVDRACMPLFDEEIVNKKEEVSNNSDEVYENTTEANNNNNNVLEEDNDFLLKLENCYKEVDTPQPDILLGETQKADLLKALSNIDNENNTNFYQPNINTNSSQRCNSKKLNEQLLNGPTPNGNIVTKQ